MKKRIGITTIVCLLLVGCTTFYSSVIAVTDVVDSAMKQWAQANKARQTTPEFNAQVVKLHDNYRLAASAAQSALILYKETGDATNLVSALETAKNGAGPLVDFIIQILAPTKGTELKTQLAKATKP